MARDDVGLGPLWVAGAWLISARIRRLAQRRNVAYRPMRMHPSGADLDVLGRLVGEGRLKPVIDRVHPFDEIGDALAHVEGGRAKG